MSRSVLHGGQLPSGLNERCATTDTRFPHPYHPEPSKSGQMVAVPAPTADVLPDAPIADVPKAVVAVASSARQDGKWGYILIFASILVCFGFCYFYG